MYKIPNKSIFQFFGVRIRLTKKIIIVFYRSHHPLKLNEWHTVKVSRTGLLAEIQVDRQRRVSHIGAGAFTQVSTSEYNVYIGGVPTFDFVSPYIPVTKSFQGCIQKVT